VPLITRCFFYSTEFDLIVVLGRRSQKNRSHRTTIIPPLAGPAPVSSGDTLLDAIRGLFPRRGQTRRHLCSQRQYIFHLRSHGPGLSRSFEGLTTTVQLITPDGKKSKSSPHPGNRTGGPYTWDRCREAGKNITPTGPGGNQDWANSGWNTPRAQKDPREGNPRKGRQQALERP